MCTLNNLMDRYPSATGRKKFEMKVWDHSNCGNKEARKHTRKLGRKGEELCVVTTIDSFAHPIWPNEDGQYTQKQSPNGQHNTT
jgi:hypothetical protein